MLSTLFLIAAGVTSSYQPAGAPATAAPGPIIHVVRDVDLAKGVVFVEQVKLRPEKREMKQQMNVNGRSFVRTQYQQIYIHEIISVPLRVGDAVVRTAAGKSMTIDAALERLRAGMRIALSADGLPVAPEHLKNLPPDTLVLTRPARE